MLHSILDLADVDVEIVMQHRREIFMIDASLPTSQIVEGLGQPIPYSAGEINDNIVGVMHAKGMLREVRTHTGDMDALDIDNIATAVVYSGIDDTAGPAGPDAFDAAVTLRTGG